MKEGEWYKIPGVKSRDSIKLSKKSGFCFATAEVTASMVTGINLKNFICPIPKHCMSCHARNCLQPDPVDWVVGSSVQDPRVAVWLILTFSCMLGSSIDKPYSCSAQRCSSLILVSLEVARGPRAVWTSANSQLIVSPMSSSRARAVQDQGWHVADCQPWVQEASWSRDAGALECLKTMHLAGLHVWCLKTMECQDL